MKVCVLLSTYNGEKYIGELLESLYAQKNRDDIIVLARDDGSSDSTVQILNDWVKKLRMEIICGENIGARDSFWELIKKAPEADFYAYCDQDDIWESDKLRCAVDKLTDYDGSIPSLYACNIQCVNQYLEKIEPLNCFQQEDITIQRIFVSNCILGCTMVFNRELLKKLRKIDFSVFFMHDVVTVLTALVTGVFIYDEDKHMLYRQQENSVTQKKAQSFTKKIKNSCNLWFRSKERSISKQADELLKDFSGEINHSDKEKLELIRTYKSKFNRFKVIGDSQYRSNNGRENRSFLVRVILGLA